MTKRIKGISSRFTEVTEEIAAEIKKKTLVANSEDSSMGILEKKNT